MNASAVRQYIEDNGCSVKEAQIAVKRWEFVKELREDFTVSDIAATLIKILEFEFGEGYDL